MFAEDSTGISIEIMGKQHKFTCSNEDAENLKQAAQKLADMCDDIKKTGVVNSERTLLVASLNLSYSLLMANNKLDYYQHKQNTLISTLEKVL